VLATDKGKRIQLHGVDLQIAQGIHTGMRLTVRGRWHAAPAGSARPSAAAAAAAAAAQSAGAGGSTGPRFQVARIQASSGGQVLPAPTMAAGLSAAAARAAAAAGTASNAPRASSGASSMAAAAAAAPAAAPAAAEPTGVAGPEPAPQPNPAIPGSTLSSNPLITASLDTLIVPSECRPALAWACTASCTCGGLWAE